MHKNPGMKVGDTLLTFQGALGGSLTEGGLTHLFTESVKTGKWE